VRHKSTPITFQSACRRLNTYGAGNAGMKIKIDFGTKKTRATMRPVVDQNCPSRSDLESRIEQLFNFAGWRCHESSQ
jgi:hypothetical protein